MRSLIPIFAALLVCASLGASPAVADTSGQSAATDDASLEMADEMAEGDNRNDDGNLDEFADEDSDRSDARTETRTRVERKRYLYASAQRKAVRRTASAQHRRVYRYHRYLRSAGPFYRKNLRQPLPAENVED